MQMRMYSSNTEDAVHVTISIGCSGSVYKQQYMWWVLSSLHCWTVQAKDYFTAMFRLASEDQMLHDVDVTAHKKGVAR